MAKFPTDQTTPTLPLPPRLRLLSHASAASLADSDPDDAGLQMSLREQLLRAKQLLLQLKGLGQTPDTPGLQENLAMLRLTIRSLEVGEVNQSQLNDVRLVLDEVTRHLNVQSQQRRTINTREDQRNQLTEWFENAIQKDCWPLDGLRELAHQLYREYLSQAPPLWWYHATPNEPFLWAASHGLNTAQVLQRMLHPVRFSSRHIQNAILAGLLHDLGMTRLPVKVLAAQEQTNSTTRQQWRNHAPWLAERLRPYLKPEEFEVAQAIAQHHERMNGSGYPMKLAQQELIELGRQLAVADCYAALCQPRPHRKAHSTRQAVRLVLQEAQLGRLDPWAAVLLLPWAAAPVGSMVELADGSTGRVVAWNQVATSGEYKPIIMQGNSLEQIKVLDLDIVRDRQVIRTV
jgi:HD-GYP domain-containing protein (c-di-GMP phosphodiesterase class II)